MGGKQADRTAKKQGTKKQEEEETSSGGGASGGAFVERAKNLATSSILLQLGPKIPDFAKTGIELIKSGQSANGHSSSETNKENEGNKEEKDTATAEDKDADTAEEKTEGSVPDRVLDADAGGAFKKLHSQLSLFNPLGLFSSGDDTVKEFMKMKGLELDFGPRAKKKGNPKIDRIVTNVVQNLPQYIYVFFALMVLRAFLFRSFIACLPWLVLYQFLSVDLPLEPAAYRGLPLDKAPLDKAPVELRVVLTVGLHGLVWLFFLYEVVFKVWWIELIIYSGLIGYHAFAVRPVEA